MGVLGDLGLHGILGVLRNFGDLGVWGIVSGLGFGGGRDWSWSGFGGWVWSHLRGWDWSWSGLERFGRLSLGVQGVGNFEGFWEFWGILRNFENSGIFGRFGSSW